MVTPRRPRVEQMDVVEVEVLTFTKPTWMRDAACKEHPTTMFFPERGQSPAKALEVCARCLVLDDCTAYVVANPELRGIWAGTTDADRNTVRSRRT